MTRKVEAKKYIIKEEKKLRMNMAFVSNAIPITATS